MCERHRPQMEGLSVHSSAIAAAVPAAVGHVVPATPVTPASIIIPLPAAQLRIPVLPVDSATVATPIPAPVTPIMPALPIPADLMAIARTHQQ